MGLESREAAAADPQSKLLFPCKFVIIKMAMVNMRYNTVAWHWDHLCDAWTCKP